MDDVYRPRPAFSYGEEGANAYFAVRKDRACPYLPGSLAAADWLIGFRETALDEARMLDSDGALHDPDETLGELDLDLRDARAARRRILFAVHDSLPTIDECERAVGRPASEWPSNCYAVSSAIVAAGLLGDLEAAHGKASARYGVYDGEVVAGTLFAGRPIIRHGWIEFDGGLVVDPTRFVFTGTDPALWVDSIDDYDLGANRLRQRRPDKPVPEHDPGQPQLRWTANDPEVTARVSELLADPGLGTRRRLTAAQAFWLANRPPEIIGSLTPSIYRALDAIGCGGYIPIDNREHACPEQRMMEFATATCVATP